MFRTCLYQRLLLADRAQPSMCVSALVLYAVRICRRPAYHSLWAHEGRYGGWGLGAADTTAQFKEIQREMQLESEHCSFYIHLGGAWENSPAIPPPHPSPSCPQCGYRQEGKWTYRCCIVLLRHCNTPESVICQKKTTKKIPLNISMTAKC